MAEHWDPTALSPTAVGISVSRRTDICWFYTSWFRQRLREGYAEYIPAGPPRRIGCSLAPHDVTHFNFWTKWPRPFFLALDEVLGIGFPVLWNVTITGLGGTEVERNVPAPERVVAAVIELSKRVPSAGIQWRFDPLFVSERFPPEFHVENFKHLAGRLVGHVDRVTTSFIVHYGRRVNPDLEAYQRESGDALLDPSQSQQIDLLSCLREIAEENELPFTLCCQPGLRDAVGCESASCNGWDWVCRVYPALRQYGRGLSQHPTRAGCACSEEKDIGVYDTCPGGCRYSYGSCSQKRALGNRARHDPNDPCLLRRARQDAVRRQHVRSP